MPPGEILDMKSLLSVTMDPYVTNLNVCTNIKTIKISIRKKEVDKTKDGKYKEDGKPQEDIHTFLEARPQQPSGTDTKHNESAEVQVL